VSYTDPTTGNVSNYYVEQGVPGDYASRGATTVAQYQTMASQDLSDKQIAAQSQIAQQQQAFNQQQADAQAAQYAQQQQQAQDQATRQSEYDTGRAQTLGEGTQQINDAFAKFSPDYFNQYAQDYMSKAQDDITYQQNIAQKALQFSLARQGISSSQAGVNQEGLIQESSGRATAAQTANAQQAEAQLQGNVASAKQNLLGQVTSAESIGSPIAGSSEQDVNAALNTQRSTISGIAANAGNTVASINGVPTVNPLSNIFAGVLGSTGSYLSGLQANAALGAYKSAAGGLAAPGPSQGSTK
jgi:multidrug efflux pump subunit AcrA (membrane-fusion protein)